MYNPTKKGSYFPSCCSFGFVFFFFFTSSCRMDRTWTRRKKKEKYATVTR